MTDVGSLGKAAWRDWETDGVPSTGPREPAKAEIRQFTAEVEKQKPTVVADVAALRTYPGDATAALVNCHTTAEDDGGGIFVVKAGDTSSVDNNGTVIVDARGRRWMRQIGDFLIPEHFGARGDDSTDDTVAIQKALDAAVAAKVELVLLGKTYKTTTRIAVSSFWTTIRGVSLEATIKIYSTSEPALYVPNHVAEFRFDNFTIDRVGIPTAGADGLFVGHSSWGVVSDVTSISHWHGFNLGAAGWSLARFCEARRNYGNGFNFRNSTDDPSYRAQQWETVECLAELNDGWGFYHLSVVANNTMGTWARPSTYANGLGGIGVFGQSGCSISDLVIIGAICSTNGNDNIRLDPWGGGNNRINGAFCELAGTESTGRSKGGAGEIPTSNQGCGVHIGGTSTQGWVQLTDIMTMLNAEEGVRDTAGLTMVIGSNITSKGNCANIVSNRYGINLGASATKYALNNIVSGAFTDGVTTYTQAYGVRAANANNVTITGGNLETNTSGAVTASAGSFSMVGVQGATGAIAGRTLLLQEDAAAEILTITQFNPSLTAGLGLQHVSAGSNFFIERFSNGLVRHRQIGNFSHQFWVNDTFMFEVNPEGAHSEISLTLKDGVTAPAPTNGKAKIYVDVADGDLKVKFGDGTIKTIATDT